MTDDLNAIPSTAPAVRFDDYGGIDVLRVVDVLVPAPTDAEVLVRVEAAGINPGEASIRRGAMKEMFPATFPSGEGTDFAGVVMAIGSGVTTFAVGDEVIGWSEKRSSQAAYVAVPATQLIRKPSGIEWPVAGALFVVGVTAFAAVRAIAPRAGELVVVSAAGGGVGSLVVQLLRLAGCTVVGIASESDHDWLRSKHVIPVAYGDGIAARIRAAAPDGIDALIDTHGPEYIDLGIELGIPVDRIETVIAFEAASRVGAKAEGSSDASSADILATMAEHVAAGEVEVRISRTFPLASVREAFELQEHGHPRGKIVLIP